MKNSLPRFLIGSLAGVWLAGISGHAVAAEAEKNARNYSVFLLSTKAGVQTVQPTAEGEEAFFEFTDRGRGARVTAQFATDAQGVLTRYTGTGNDYLKSAVDEKFSLANGAATWSNAKEEGSKPGDASAGFYVPADAPPELMAVLARALLTAPAHRLNLLPDGSAAIQAGESVELDTAAGKRRVTRYSISGMDLEPIHVWLDDQRQLFALISGWMTIVAAGEEAAVPKLREIQDAADKARRKESAQKLVHAPPDAGLLVKNARVFDSVDGAVRAKHSVLVVGNRIAAVGPDDKILVPAGVEVMDAHDRFLMPGLWDCHVHMDGSDAVLHLANGVTTVRDMGNDYDVLSALKSRIEAGEEIGPRIFMAGLIDGHGPFAGPTKQFVDNEEDAHRVVNWLADHGYVQLKIYSSIPARLVPLLAELAHARGMRVSGHVPAFMTAEQFVRGGADEIQHINFVFLNFLADQVKDTRAMARFSAVAEHAGSIRPDGPKEREFISLLRAHHTVIDPTVGVFESMFGAKPRSVSPGMQAVAGRLPPQVRRNLLGGGLTPPKDKVKEYAETVPSMLRFIKGLHDAGVTIVAGTDSFAGFNLHRELELYVQAGIPAPEVLQIATLGAARVMGVERNLGRVAAGANADFILIDGDPSKRISDIRHVRTVIKDGKVYDAAQLLEAVGIRADDAVAR